MRSREISAKYVSGSGHWTRTVNSSWLKPWLGLLGLRLCCADVRPDRILGTGRVGDAPGLLTPGFESSENPWLEEPGSCLSFSREHPFGSACLTIQPEPLPKDRCL